MTAETRKATQSVRPIVFVGAGTLLYFLTLLLVLYVLDRQIYTAEKLEVMRDHFARTISLPELNDYAKQTLFAKDAAQQSAARQTLEIELGRITDSASILYQFELRDADKRAVLKVENLSLIHI